MELNRVPMAPLIASTPAMLETALTGVAILSLGSLSIIHNFV